MNYPIKASLLPAILFAAAVVFALYVVQLLLFPDGSTDMYSRIVWGNFISPAILGIFLIAMFLLVSKRRKLAAEKKNSSWFMQEIAPRLIDQHTRIEELTDKHAALSDNLMANRWNNVQSDTDNNTALKHAELENEHLQNSYSLPRFFVWALPIVGFIGTVWGIGLSISFFSDTMGASQSGASVSTMLQQNIPLVTKGLSTAFDTTLLALVLSLPATGFLVLTERDERDYLLRLEEHWKNFISSHYNPVQELVDDEYTHAQAIGESLRDLREDAFDRYQQEPSYRD